MLRVRVELVPHGNEERAVVLDEVWAENDGTAGRAPDIKADTGGKGNYRFYHPPVGTDAWETKIGDCVGTYEGLTRTPEHRLLLAKLALEATIAHNSRRETLAQDA